MNEDLSYYQHRTAAEKEAAETAPDGRAKAVHIELARRYDEHCTRLAKEVDVDCASDAATDGIDSVTT